MYKEINILEFIIHVIWAKKHKIGEIYFIFEIMIFSNLFIKACCQLLILGWNALVSDSPTSSLFVSPSAMSGSLFPEIKSRPDLLALCHLHIS